MKTLIKLTCLLLGLLLFSPMVIAQEEDFFTIRGTVKNAKNKKKIEYANVIAVGTQIGTISNENGEFSLKIPYDAAVREIEFSSIGFYNARFTIAREDIDGKEFLMTPSDVSLKEVEVHSWKYPVDLVKAAVDKVEDNYSLYPTLLTTFYRETAQKGKKYINVSEAVVNIYKSSYSRDSHSDRVQLLKGRRLVSPNPADTLSVRLLGGPNMAIYADLVKNPDMLLGDEVLNWYQYRMGEGATIDDRLQYVIYFEPQVNVEAPLYKGTFYIDKENLAFTRIEFDLDMSDKDKVTRMILREKPKGLRFNPTEVLYIVSYKQQNGLTRINYLRNEIRFKCDWKRKLFATNYTVISEMVVTDVFDDKVERIKGRDSFSARKSLSDEVKNYYDPDFWGAYNIIEPTESLESAIGKLKREE